jgi:hypothetical protein
MTEKYYSRICPAMAVSRTKRTAALLPQPTFKSNVLCKRRKALSCLPQTAAGEGFYVFGGSFGGVYGGTFWLYYANRTDGGVFLTSYVREIKMGGCLGIKKEYI